jgi:hypothetical protein
MATIKTRPVIGDNGSQELAQLRKSYNALVQVVGDLITSLKGSTDVPSIVVIVTAAELVIQSTVEKIGTQPNLGLNPTRPDLLPSTLRIP